MYKQITNHYDPGLKRPKLCCEEWLVHVPSEGWRYAHHPFLAWFAGRYFLCYSNGHVNEDDVGQRICYVTSDDFETWSEPQVLVAPPAVDGYEAVLLPGGLYTDGTQLVAYYSGFSYDPAVLKDGWRQNGPAGRNWLGSFYITTADGDTWTDPEPMPGGGGNTQPRALQSGRLLSAGGSLHAYSDCPDGIHGWETVRCFPEGYPNNAPGGKAVIVDTPIGRVSDTKVGLCEGSFVQTDDGTVYMFLRSETPRLWACESHDEGESWSLPQPTRFSDNRTKFCLGRLPNGRFYYVGTPDPFPPRTRHILVLSTSDDGLDYDRHYILADAQYKGRYPGIDKNGVYGYPNVLVRDGCMHIAVSINKESIMALRVPCDTL